jgi:hypothetical protein
MLKDGTSLGNLWNMMSPVTFSFPPFGDNPIDFMWNTKGMTDAASEIGLPPPGIYLLLFPKFNPPKLEQ